MKQLYYGPHCFRAIACLQAGYPENAVSWMWRDIGEYRDDPGEQPDHKSLRIVDAPEVNIPKSLLPCIEYVAVKDLAENLIGAWI